MGSIRRISETNELIEIIETNGKKSNKENFAAKWRRNKEWWLNEPQLSLGQTIAHLKRLMRLHSANFAARKRFGVIVLTLEGQLTAAAIAIQVGVSRASVFAYRRIFRTRGIEGLNRPGPGRPKKPSSLPLEAAITQGLRRMSSFHLPALHRWVRHYGGQCSDWTLRQLAKASIAVNHFRFVKRWHSPPTRQTKSSQSPGDGQASLGLMVTESPGLKPWFDLPKDDWGELSPYMRQGRLSAVPAWKW